MTQKPDYSYSRYLAAKVAGTAERSSTSPLNAINNVGWNVTLTYTPAIARTYTAASVLANIST